MILHPSASVIIAFYKRLDFLEKIFEGLKNQSRQDFEVIVAEDNNSELTVSFIKEKQVALPFQIKHVSQEDKGFRKTRILNEALKISSSENILFLDGDCIPHRHFVKHYCERIIKGTAFFGRRVMLGETFTAKLLQQHTIKSLQLVSLIFSDSDRIEDGIYLPWLKKNKKEYRGIWGCNWGISRHDLFEINGFDEDYVHASVGEDNDIEWRLRFNGINFKSLKHKAIVYHMHHKENYNNEAFLINNSLFEQKKKLQSAKCLNGLGKITK
ncbi:MAG: glycosyltransferase [Bacteroidia bacterium]|nr:glycosyltransferase [Bacteroidia bacterium]